VNPLKVDVDGGRPLRLSVLVRRLARARRRVTRLAQRRSPSGRGWHLWVWVKPAPRSAVETVTLQALCGSDLEREAYNLNRATLVDDARVSAFWRRRWNVLYK
jgi:hypothetical protein